MAKKKKKGTNSEERVKFLTRIGNTNSKKLRSRLTKWELILKKHLVDLGYNFKIQFPIICNKKHLYIVDFLLVDYNIFLEADGVSTHGTKETIKKDKIRTRNLRKEGYEPIRFWNKQLETFTKEQIDNIIKLKLLFVKESQKICK